MILSTLVPVEPRSPRRRRARLLAPLLGSIALVLSLLGGCSREEASTPGSARAPSEHLVAAIQVEPASTITRHERPGSLRFRRLVRLFSQEEGRVTQFDLFEGDRVAADALLVVLDDDLLLAELDRARATRAQAELDVQRLSDLVARRAASDAELSQARTALAVAEADVRLLETRLAFTRISAPFAGVVTERLVEPGDFVGKNTHLLTIADPDSLVAEVFVSEFILPGVRRADPAQVRIDALGTATFPAQVLRIHPQLEATSRQGLIELALEEAPPGAAAGQFVRVTLETAAVERLMIPFRALRRDRDGELVWVIEESGAVARRSVRSGLQMDDRIEILDGLTAGERIVTRGFLGLSEGKTVRVVPE